MSRFFSLNWFGLATSITLTKADHSLFTMLCVMGASEAAKADLSRRFKSRRTAFSPSDQSNWSSQLSNLHCRDIPEAVAATLPIRLNCSQCPFHLQSTFCAALQAFIRDADISLLSVSREFPIK
jgi:hypothetical protein